MVRIIHEMVLFHCNIVNKQFLRYSRVFSLVFINKSLNKLLYILPTSYIYIETICLEFSYIKVWFTDQNSGPLETKEHRLNLTLVSNDRGI